MELRIDDSGRVRIPRRLRRRLGLVPGTRLEVEEEPGALRLRIVPERPLVVERGGVLVVTAGAAGGLDGAVDEQRRARLERAGRSPAPDRRGRRAPEDR